MIDSAQEADALGDAELCRQVAQVRHLAGAGVAVAADDEDEAVGLGFELRGRAEQNVDALQRLDPADEEQDLVVIAEAELLPRLALVYRLEHAEVDAAGHDGDAVRVRIVVADEQLPLVLAGDDDAIGLARDRPLRFNACRRLPFADAGAGLRFAERVEHRDVRHAPARL